MKYLLAIASLMATCIPVQAGNVYLQIKSEGVQSYSVGVALHSIPMESMEQCEEVGAVIVASERLDTKYAKRDGFECIEGK